MDVVTKLARLGRVGFGTKVGRLLLYEFLRALLQLLVCSQSARKWDTISALSVARRRENEFHLPTPASFRIATKVFSNELKSTVVWYNFSFFTLVSDTDGAVLPIVAGGKLFLLGEVGGGGARCFTVAVARFE